MRPIAKPFQFIFLLAFLFTVSCSKDDDSTEADESTLKLESFTNIFDTYDISYLPNGKPQALIQSSNSAIHPKCPGIFNGITFTSI